MFIRNMIKNKSCENCYWIKDIKLTILVYRKEAFALQDQNADNKIYQASKC